MVLNGLEEKRITKQCFGHISYKGRDSLNFMERHRTLLCNKPIEIP